MRAGSPRGRRVIVGVLIVGAGVLLPSGVLAAPGPADDAVSTAEDTALVITAAELLANDTDAVAVVGVSQPATGSITDNGDDSYTYTPPGDFHGSDAFTYDVTDGTDTATATVHVTVTSANDAPVAADGSATGSEDTAIPVVLAATDVDGDALTFEIVGAPDDGSLSDCAGGSCAYTPDADFNGSDSLTFRASDGDLDSNIATFDLTVDPVNDAPTALNDSYATPEDTALVVNAGAGIRANDSDPDGDALTVAVVSPPSSGSLSSAPNGSFTYTPAANDTGPVTFTYRASDGDAESNLATATITITPVNDAPVASAGSTSVGEGGSAPISLDATDVDDASLTFEIVNPPDHGSLSNCSDGTCTYTPVADYNGADSFTFRASDGELDSNIVGFAITVDAVNDAPTAQDRSYSLAEDATRAVTLLASDADGDSLSYLIVDDPAHGTVECVPAGGPACTYEPDPDYHGPDTFTYRADDGAAQSNLATVAITVTPVNDAPDAVDDSYATPEDTQLVVGPPGVLANDDDVDGGTLEASELSDPPNGSVTVAANGGFTYTPAAGFTGNDSFTYSVSDGTVTDTATVSIAVSSVNDAPVAVNDSYATPEDTTLVVPAGAGVRANDSDPDGDALTVSLVTPPESGSLSLAANGSFTYTPGANANGAVSFTYRASDGSAQSNVATATIAVSAVNDAPIAQGGSASVAEGGSTPIALDATDVDGDELDFAIVDPPDHGSLSDCSDGLCTYSPTGNYHGDDSFTFRANDGVADSNTATFDLTIDPVNDPPVAVNDSYATPEDTALVVPVGSGVRANDSDPDGDALTVVVVTPPASGSLSLAANGSFTYTPAANANGAVSFTYRANDGAAQSNPATVTISVTPVNDAPTAANDAYVTTEDTQLVVSAPGVLAGDADVEGSPLTVTAHTAASSGSVAVAANGSFTYTPAANFVGEATFGYTVSDGAATDTAIVTVTVGADNDPPVAVNDAYVTPEDTALVVPVGSGVRANDSDVDGDALTVAVVAAPASGSLSLAANGSFTFTPAANANGPVTFTYRASDGAAQSNPATVTITVTAVNDAPVAANDAYGTPEDVPLVVAAPGVLAGDTDVEGSPLTVTAHSAASSGSVVVAANGSFTYTPAVNFVGEATFGYTVSDGAATDTAVVTVTVGADNDPPIAVNDSYATPEDTALVVPVGSGVRANDSDVDGDPLTVAVVAAPASGSLSLAANGSFTYTPAANANGPVTFTYRANDGTADSNVATVTITVTAVNDAPVAANDAYGTSEDQLLVVPVAGVLANDSDADGNPLTSAKLTEPAHGTVTLLASGAFSYTPAPDYHGPDSFTYRVGDGTAVSAPATVSISVESVNDAPVAANDAYATPEDTPLVIPVATGVRANDTDVDGNPLTVALLGAPATGSLTLAANGSFTYTPAANANGPVTFTYRVNDGTADSNVATVTITVAGTGDAPVAVSDAHTTPEDTPLVVAVPGVLANDLDADGDPLTAVKVTEPGHGTLTLLATGAFVYTPAPNYHGPDSFTYQASDGTASSAPVAVSISVTAVNDRPVATGGAYVTAEDGTLAVDVPGVLAGDTDVEADPLVATPTVLPAHGTLALAPNGSFTYTPAPDYHGPDSFSYAASDGAASSTPVVVALTVTPVNDAPVAKADGAPYAVELNTARTVAAPGLLGNDLDVDGDALTAAKVTNPAHGTVVVQSNGGFTYTPAANYKGTDSFTYRVSDGALGAVASVSLKVDVGVLPVSIVGTAGPDDRGFLSSLPQGLNVDLRNGGDIARVYFGNLRGPVAVNDSGSSGVDAVVAYGTARDDRIDAATNKITSGAQRVTVSRIERLDLDGGPGNDKVVLDLRALRPRAGHVEGNAGNDALVVDARTRNARIAGDTIVVDGLGSFTFSGFEQVTLLRATGTQVRNGTGYWLFASDGGVFTFGSARFYGSTGGLALKAPVVQMIPTASGRGYWMLASDGGVFAFGDAGFYGSTGALALKAPITQMIATPSGRGYWLLASDGGVFSFGDARFFGSTGGLQLRAPITQMVATPSGRGYWLLASDGGVFTFGDARYYGSAARVLRSAPVVALVPTPLGDGYWILEADGRVTAFGSVARIPGPTRALSGGARAVQLVPSPSGRGYWTLATNGLVQSFGDARYFGDVSGLRVAPIAQMTVTPTGAGYWLLGRDGGIFAFGDARFYGSTGALVLKAPITALLTPGGA